MTALPLPGPEKSDCGCGCGMFGTLKREHRDGTRCVRGCPCRRCKGRNVKRSSGNRERRVAKRLGGERAVLSGALSGYDIRVALRGGVPLYIEETTAQNVTRGIESWWGNKTIVGKTARLMAQKDGLRMLMLPGLCVMPRADAEQLIQLAGEDE